MANTVRLTVAQALVKFLNNQYIEFDGKQNKMFKGIFTIFGHGNVVGLGEALENDPGDLIVHQGRNEQGMAHAAMGYAKQKRRKQIYACTSSVGPGAANMVTAAATATANCIPVLFLPGDVYATRQPDPVLQQMEQPHDLSISTNDAFRAVSKYWDRVTRPEQLMSACINAMRVLTDPADTGAVTIALPQDVEGEAYDYPEYFFQKRVHRIDRRPATKAMVEDAIKLITAKKKPMLICGGGVKYSEAWDTFREFAHKYNIPFGETQAGKGVIVWDDPMNLNGLGETGCIAANEIAKEADLVIGVGTRYTDFTTSSKWIFQNPEVSFLNINVSEFHAYKLDGVQVVADAKVALEAIDAELEKTGWKSSYTTEIAAAKAKYVAETDRLYNLEYTGKDFVPEIDDALDTDKVYEEFLKLADRKKDIHDDDILVLAGSIPNTLPEDIYEKILASLESKGIRIVVDATKDLLLNVLKYHPFLIKPNNHELGEMFGIVCKTDEDIVHYAKKLQEKGAVNVLISMAGDGAILITEDGQNIKMGTPKGKVVNSVGAGDSMVAGFITGYIRGGNYEEALKSGTAAGSATAFSEGLASLEMYEKMLKQITE